MKILITGSDGFIASHLNNKIKAKFYKPKIYYFDRGGKLPRGGVDLVFHLAANARARQCIENPELAMENVEVTKQVLDWMVKTKTPKIIFTSSREAFALDNPYGASKLACESFIEAYCKSYNLGGVSVRLSNVYGQGDHEDRFIPTAIASARENKAIIVYGGKQKLLNFIYVKDVVNVLVNYAHSIANSHHYFIELAYPRSFSLVDIAEKIIKMVDSNSEIREVGRRNGEVDIYHPQNPINWNFTYGLHEGIKSCL